MCHPTKTCTPLMVDVQQACNIGIMWNVLGILLSGEMMSLEKHPVFLDYHRIALGRASSCKILLQCIIWQFSMQFNGKGGLETTRLNVSLVVELVLDESIARSSVSYHIKILGCVHGMLAQ